MLVLESTIHIVRLQETHYSFHYTALCLAPDCVLYIYVCVKYHICHPSLVGKTYVFSPVTWLVCQVILGVRMYVNWSYEIR